MTARRHDSSRRSRRPGAGRPRKVPRTSTRPVDEEIVGEASRLFARQGVAATTMAQVADASGLQVSSIYYYFRSKEAILERILAAVNTVPLELLAAATEAYDDPVVQLYAFVRADGTALCRFPFDINEVHSLARSADFEFAGYWAERRDLEDRVERVVQAGVEVGALLPLDARITALTVLANDEAAQSWYRPRGRGVEEPTHGLDADEVGVLLADMALRSLLVDRDRLDEIRASTSPS